MTKPYSILVGDCRESMRGLPAGHFQCAVTSPPYWGLRDYGCAGQLGLEETPEAYIVGMVEVFREVRRVLRDDGTLWLNIGDAYNAYNGNRGVSKGANKNHLDIQPRLPQGHGLSVSTLKAKDLIGLPWMLAFALRADGWYLRSDIIWAKPNPMPESVTDRPTKAHEYLFLLTKKPTYFYDAEAIRESAEYGRRTTFRGSGYENNNAFDNSATRPSNGANRSMDDDPSAGRNKRTVWTIATQAYPESHFATFPEALVEPCIKAGSRIGDEVLDPFGGSGTTAAVAVKLQRRATICELNPAYAAMAERRIGLALAPGTFRDESAPTDAPLFGASA